MKKSRVRRAPEPIRRAHARLGEAKQRVPRIFRLRGRKSGPTVEWGKSGEFFAVAWRFGEVWRWTWRAGVVDRNGEAPTLGGCATAIKLTTASVQKNLAATLACIIAVRRASK
ncbi:MAG TPA: hypothetical protein VGB13_13455 [Candidatus Krumholzibacteria bacterium]